MGEGEGGKENRTRVSRQFPPPSPSPAGREDHHDINEHAYFREEENDNMTTNECNTIIGHLFHKKYSKDVSREFDEFQVNNHLCKMRCWYL